MIRLEFNPQKPATPNRKRHLSAVAVSFLFHGLLVCLVIGAAWFYEVKVQPNGSRTGSESMSLPALVIVSAPPEKPVVTPVSPQPIAPTPPSAPTIIETPEASVPVAEKKENPPVKSVAQHSTTLVTHPKVEPQTSHASPPATAAPSPSSFTPGPNSLPHPPYPEEARALRESGTVTMHVQFSASGDVANAQVLKSSGVQILDSTTRAYILAHWHEPAFAGRTVSIPVIYKLEDLR